MCSPLTSFDDCEGQRLAACSCLCAFACIKLVPVGAPHASAEAADDLQWAMTMDQTADLVVQGSFSAAGTFAAYVPATREVQECDVPEEA